MTVSHRMPHHLHVLFVEYDEVNRGMRSWTAQVIWVQCMMAHKALRKREGEKARKREKERFETSLSGGETGPWSC